MAWMGRMKFLAIPALFLAAMLVPSLLQAGEGAETLIGKTVTAYGGERALSRVATVREIGRVGSRMRGVEGEILRVYRYPRDLRVEIAYPGVESEIRILHGEKGWRQGHSVSGPPFEAMVLQAERLALPRNLLAAAGRIEDLGTVEREGKTLRALSFLLGNGMSMRVEIDPATGRILRSVGRSESGMGSMPGGIEFVTEYGDFREIDGVLFPFREKNFAMGHHTGDTVLRRIEILPEAPQDSFRP